MGRVTTPTYRIEFTVDRGYWTACSWQGKYNGRANAANLAAVCMEMERATYPRGVNSHLGVTHILSAKIVRQSTNEVVADYIRQPVPLFEVI